MRLLRGVGSHLLPCGCLVGLYETYDARTVAIIDAQGASCPNAEHRMDAETPVEPARATTESVRPPRR
jgi:hypothetical protein